jgi:hypothetical protein
MSGYYYAPPDHLLEVEARLARLGRPVYRGLTAQGKPHMNVGPLSLQWHPQGVSGIVWYALHGSEVHWCFQPVERL